jgi:hypothetical protein
MPDADFLQNLHLCPLLGGYPRTRAAPLDPWRRDWLPCFTYIDERPVRKPTSRPRISTTHPNSDAIPPRSADKQTSGERPKMTRGPLEKSTIQICRRPDGPESHSAGSKPLLKLCLPRRRNPSL